MKASSRIPANKEGINCALSSHFRRVQIKIASQIVTELQKKNRKTFTGELSRQVKLNFISLVK